MFSSDKPRRTQLLINRLDQLRTPDQLQLGQQIARLDFWPGLWVGVRGVRAVGGFLLAQMRSQPPRQQVAAAVEGWCAAGEDDMWQPIWRGVVEAIGEQRATIRPTHGTYGKDFTGYADVPEKIPPLADQANILLLSETFTDMGLAPIPDGQDCAGRWLHSVTIAL